MGTSNDVHGPTDSGHGNLKDKDEEATREIQFFPPLCIQRYSMALQILMEHNIKSVIDFGCCECEFMKLLPTVPSLEKIALVDINQDVLDTWKHVIKPEMRHFIYRRKAPLHVQLLAGSAEDTDSRLLGYEAVTLIEVIEHLYPEVLQGVEQNVFGRLKPKLCVVTTPNSEFNVLFDYNNPTTFRHWDHKFEWTRSEFQKWCKDICQKYNYSVTYTGVGRLPLKPGSEHLGPCTQAAVFRLQPSSCGETQFESTQCYTLIAESDFPYEKNYLSLEEKIDLEVSYCLRQLILSQKDDHGPDDVLSIPVTSLARLYTVRALCDEAGVRESLKRTHQRCSADGASVLVDNCDDPDWRWSQHQDDLDSDSLTSVSDQVLDEGGESMGSGEHLCSAGTTERNVQLDSNWLTENWDVP